MGSQVTGGDWRSNSDPCKKHILRVGKYLLQIRIAWPRCHKKQISLSNIQNPSSCCCWWWCCSAQGTICSRRVYKLLDYPASMKYPPWRFQERSLNGKGEVSMFAWIVWHFITTRNLPTINTSHMKKMPGCGRRLLFGGMACFTGGNC